MIVINNNRDRESTLERAIKILKYLATIEESKRLSDIADYFDIPHETTYNILKRLWKKTV